MDYKIIFLFNLQLLFVFVCGSHFYGGFFTAESSIANATHFNVKFILRLGYKRSWVGTQSPAFSGSRLTFCDETTIANGTHIAPYYYFYCDVGCNTVNEIIGNTDIACISFSQTNDWSYGETSFTYGLAVAQNYEAYYTGASWVLLNAYTIGWPTVGTQDWVMRLKISTANRSDTNHMNSSPRTLVPPIYVIRNGMSVNLHIPQFDDDGDAVQCRWSVSSGNECASICNSVPFATINLTSCVMTFDVTSNLSTNIGYYGAALQVEDFQTRISPNALSSAPLQFLVKIVETQIACSVAPVIDSYYCILTEVNKPFTLIMKATAGCSNVNISEITITGPTGLTYSQTAQVSGTTNKYYTTITWTPSSNQLGQQIICASAMDSSPMSSDVSCITVLVYSLPNTLEMTNLVSATGSPTGTLQKTQTTFQVKVNKPIYRPTRSAYIYIKSTSGVVYDKFDMIDPSATTLVVDAATNYTTVSFSAPLSNYPSGDYYVAFDNPFALCYVKYSQYCTQIEVTGIDDKSFWTFSLTSQSFTTVVVVTNTTSADSTGKIVGAVFGTLGGLAVCFCGTGGTLLFILLKRMKRRVAESGPEVPAENPVQEIPTISAAPTPAPAPAPAPAPDPAPESVVNATTTPSETAVQ